MIDLGWVSGDLTVQGKPTTVRFLFYRLVARGVLPKKYPNSNEPPSGDVSRIAGDLRHAAILPLGCIVDRGRSIVDLTGWSSVHEALSYLAGIVRLDPWDMRPLWVICESNSLAGVFEDIARTYRVPLVAFGGQASIGLLAEVAYQMRMDTHVSSTSRILTSAVGTSRTRR